LALALAAAVRIAPNAQTGHSDGPHLAAAASQSMGPERIIAQHLYQLWKLVDGLCEMLATEFGGVLFYCNGFNMLHDAEKSSDVARGQREKALCEFV
jgi:hypothetical protein